MRRRLPVYPSAHREQMLGSARVLAVRAEESA